MYLKIITHFALMDACAIGMIGRVFCLALKDDCCDWFKIQPVPVKYSLNASGSIILCRTYRHTVEWTVV